MPQHGVVRAVALHYLSGMPGDLHIIKLCVGAESVEDLAAWQSQRRAQTADGLPMHITRMWPKQATELLAGGSLYWVIKGTVQARQRLVRLDERIGADGVSRCGIVLDPAIIRTRAALRRPFQGWRYLPAAEAPADLPQARAGDDALPPELDAALSDLGLR